MRRARARAAFRGPSAGTCIASTCFIIPDALRLNTEVTRDAGSEGRMPIPRAASLTTFGLVVALSAPTRVVVLAGQTAVARPGDFNGDGSAELAVYSPLSSTWKIRGVGDGQFGLPGDVAVPADYNGDGIQDVAVWRRSTGTWLSQG